MCLNSLKGVGLGCSFGFRKVHMVDQSNIRIQFSENFSDKAVFYVKYFVPCRQPLRLAEVVNNLIYD